MPYMQNGTKSVFQLRLNTNNLLQVIKSYISCNEYGVCSFGEFCSDVVNVINLSNSIDCPVSQRVFYYQFDVPNAEIHSYTIAAKIPCDNPAEDKTLAKNMLQDILNARGKQLYSDFDVSEGECNLLIELVLIRQINLGTPCISRPIDPNPYRYRQDNYNAFGNGPFGNSAFGNGPFANGPFGNSAFGNGPFANGPFGNGPFANSAFGYEPFSNSPFNNNSYGNGPYGFNGAR